MDAARMALQEGGKKGKEKEFSVCSANSTLLSTANFCVQRTSLFLGEKKAF
jgi:hypothetical protein